jgi:multisubunit Na+/H+ antiporter MnhB subunit
MWWRGAIIALLLGLGVAMTVAWGWKAAAIYSFFLGLAVIWTAFAVLWGRLAQRSGGWYYERQLHGYDRRHR